MFKNLNHALRWTFEVLERDITGYSNTAAIMRLGEQCGASASTSPDDLTIQEQKAQAVWVSDLIYHNTTLQEYCAIELFYNPSVKNNNGDLVVIYNQLLFTSCIDVNLPDNLVFSLIANIYKSNNPSHEMKFIAENFGLHRSKLYRLRDRVEKQLREWQYSGEKKIEDLLIEKGLINRLT